MFFQSAHYKHQALKRSPSISSWGITDTSGKLPVLTKATAALAHVSQRTFCVLTRNVNCTEKLSLKTEENTNFYHIFYFLLILPSQKLYLALFLMFLSKCPRNHLYFLKICFHKYTLFIILHLYFITQFIFCCETKKMLKLTSPPFLCFRPSPSHLPCTDLTSVSFWGFLCYSNTWSFTS